jgi:hypothetical protein
MASQQAPGTHVPNFEALLSSTQQVLAALIA